MKKCPHCDQAMSEYVAPTEVRPLQLDPDPVTEVPDTVVRYQCKHCGHEEQELGKTK